MKVIKFIKTIRGKVIKHEKRSFIFWRLIRLFSGSSEEVNTFIFMNMSRIADVIRTVNDNQIFSYNKILVKNKVSMKNKLMFYDIRKRIKRSVYCLHRA